MDLVDHLARLVHALQGRDVPYALCGGLALAVHAAPRATLDIDLLVLEEDLERLKEVAREVGFTLDTGWIPTRTGVRIYRVAAVDHQREDVIPLDLVLVGPGLEEAWATRIVVEWEHGRLSVLDPQGLISMKALRGSAQDLADIERLRDPEEGGAG